MVSDKSKLPQVTAEKREHFNWLLDQFYVAVTNFETSVTRAEQATRLLPVQNARQRLNEAYERACEPETEVRRGV